MSLVGMISITCTFCSISTFLKLFSDSTPLSTIHPRYRPPPESLNILLHLYLFNDNKDYLV